MSHICKCGSYRAFKIYKTEIAALIPTSQL
jgi:hypothetical protein